MKKTWIIEGLCLLGYCWLLKYMFHVLFPFLMAFLCYFMIKPLIDYFEKHFHMHRSAIGVSLLLVIYLIMAVLLGALLTYLVFFCIDFFQKIPEYYQNIGLPFFEQFIVYIQQRFPILLNQSYFSAFQDFIGQYFLRAMTSLSLMITQIPVYLFSFFLFIISTFFLMLDYDEMRLKTAHLLSSHSLTKFIFFKNHCLKSLWIYLKCQLILMGICFLILLLGFSILRMEHAFLYAGLTALLDSLPFIGVGIVLIPMCFVYILQGAYLKALYIFLIYLIINLVRSLLEPHIMNKQMKIPSFLLLFSMIIHLHFFGIIGIILSPIHMSLLYGLIDIKK